MKIFKIIICLLLLVSCKGNVKEDIANVSEKVEVNNQDYNLQVYDYDGLKPFLNKQDDKTYVVNFWATWCAPCIKELPYFEEINEAYKKEGVEVLLVSLDFPNQYQKRLIPFIKKHNLKSQVLALDDTDQDRWIAAINKNWTGALPATLIYNKDERKFFEKSFTYNELETELKQILK